MGRLMNIFRLRARRIAADEDGTSTIPFVIFLPFFMMLVISSVEMGIVMVRHVMLERALDMSVRGLRLGFWNPPTPLQLKQSVCRNAGLIPDCMNTLLIELRPVSKVTWQPLSSGPTCIDKAAPIQPVPTFTSGVGDEMMLVRACAKFYPMAPMTGLGFQLPKDSSGMYALVAATAFVNEPTPGG
ncbi:MAG: pilus assembly protein [Rhodobacteraceae bacterium]|nr:pilus assembly protein [Paracoccaceae bacterium]